MYQSILLTAIAFTFAIDFLLRLRAMGRMKKMLTPATKGEDPLTSALADMAKEQKKTNKFVTDVLHGMHPVAHGASRVYGALLHRGDEHSIHLLAADTIEEFTDNSRNLIGPEWVAEFITFVEVYPPKERTVYRPPNKAEKKEMGLEQGLYFLQLVKDKFAEAEQKDALDKIIGTYKKTYELK